VSSISFLSLTPSLLTFAPPTRSPGYALTLLASSTSHVLHSSEASSCPPPQQVEGWTPPSPEDLGIQAARQLLEEIRRGGCVDRGWEWLVSLMLVLGGEDVGRATVAGPFEPFLCVWLLALAFLSGRRKLTSRATASNTSATSKLSSVRRSRSRLHHHRLPSPTT
jgi:RNA 3'-terminal phosphate cyclase-like protein